MEVMSAVFQWDPFPAFPSSLPFPLPARPAGKGKGRDPREKVVEREENGGDASGFLAGAIS